MILVNYSDRSHGPLALLLTRTKSLKKQGLFNALSYGGVGMWLSELIMRRHSSTNVGRNCMIVKVYVCKVVGQTGERRSVRNWSFNCGGMTIGGFSCKISASICNKFMLNIVVSYIVKCMSLCMDGINYVIIKCKWAILFPRYDM